LNKQVTKAPGNIKSGSKVTTAMLDDIDNSELFKFILKTESGNIALAGISNQFDKLAEKFSEDLQEITQKNITA
jgi:hypothetical protein